MTPEGPADREFQLETKHLAFLIAMVLVLCVASFLFGRWVERRSQGVAIASAGAGHADETADGEVDVSKDLTFFDTLGGAGQAPLKAPPGGETGAEQMSPAPAPAKAEALSPPTSRRREGARSVGEGVMIQVFASQDRSAADAIRKKLRGKGYTALIVPSGGTYKVRVGPYADKEEAEKVSARIREEEGLETWIP